VSFYHSHSGLQLVEYHLIEGTHRHQKTIGGHPVQKREPLIQASLGPEKLWKEELYSAIVDSPANNYRRYYAKNFKKKRKDMEIKVPLTPTNNYHATN
tara:strand:- start:190 stop:483 length:294 start_codon:yes stop_codon:yes gene_type:complete